MWTEDPGFLLPEEPGRSRRVGGAPACMTSVTERTPTRVGASGAKGVGAGLVMLEMSCELSTPGGSGDPLGGSGDPLETWTPLWSLAITSAFKRATASAGTPLRRRTSGSPPGAGCALFAA